MPRQDMDPRPEIAFAAWVAKEKDKHTGRNTLDEEQGYIPLPRLQEYWTRQKISAILRSFDTPLTLDIDTIRDEYLCIFSVLVKTSTTRRFLESIIRHNLDDTRWPMDHCPAEYPWLDSQNSKEEFQDILEKQWTFFPLFLRRSKLNDRTLQEKHILPFASYDYLKHCGSASIFKVEVPNHSNDLVPCGHSADREVFVLKKYDLKDDQKSYETEVEALTMFRNSPSPNLITYHGSFRNESTGYLLLEYADQGNLEEFFSSQEHPQSAKDVEMFWTSLLRTLTGLDRIHQVMTANNYLIQG